MKVPTVDKFCCYFDLTTGGLVLGFAGAIVNAILVIFLFYELFVFYGGINFKIFEFIFYVEVADELGVENLNSGEK